MYEVDRIVAAIGPRLYEVVKGRDCGKCAFKSIFNAACYAYCADFYGAEGAHFRELDAVRSRDMLNWLEARSKEEWASTPSTLLHG